MRDSIELNPPKNLFKRVKDSPGLGKIQEFAHFRMNL